MECKDDVLDIQENLLQIDWTHFKDNMFDEK